MSADGYVSPMAWDRTLDRFWWYFNVELSGVVSVEVSGSEDGEYDDVCSAARVKSSTILDAVRKNDPTRFPSMRTVIGSQPMFSTSFLLEDAILVYTEDFDNLFGFLQDQALQRAPQRYFGPQANLDLGATDYEFSKDGKHITLTLHGEYTNGNEDETD